MTTGSLDQLRQPYPGLRPFTRDEIGSAAEAFLSSASSFVMPVTRVDATQVGDGRPGPITTRLRAAYEAYMADGPYI